MARAGPIGRVLDVDRGVKPLHRPLAVPVGAKCRDADTNHPNEDQRQDCLWEPLIDIAVHQLTEPINCCLLYTSDAADE